MVFSLLWALASAAPPVPTWTAADREVAEDTDDVELAAVSSLSSPAPVRAAPAVFGGEPKEGHGWSDPATLTFDVSGRSDRFYYVMATARGGGLVAHWRQGPIAGEDATRSFPLEVPEDLPGLLQEVGTAHLSLVIVTVDERDRELGRARLGTTWVASDGRTVVGDAPGPPLELERREGE